ncbi:SDR family oxidoreductase, partial [Lactobacillus delbrueckii]|uniref:SDR family oxidoreductase n=1 Tax=Lactobacillus delbrueckii TaxID=1584 RepID=UPI00288B7564
QFCIIHSKKGSCVFVVINIVRDNPSFFVAYFLFTQEFILNQKIAKIKHETITQQQANCLKEIALGREAKPSYVAEVVAWFASSGAGYVTGQSLQVDDGMRFH